MIEAGEELTKKLDEAGLPLTAVFWLFNPEINDWRLYVASPDVLTRGRFEVFGRVDRAVAELKEKANVIPSPGVLLLDPEDFRVRKLRPAAPDVAPAGNRLRLKNTYVDGHHVEDALVYRIG